jgi:hypothetical protein
MKLNKQVPHLFADPDPDRQHQKSHESERIWINNFSIDELLYILFSGGAHAADEDPRGGGAQDARVPLPVRAVSQAVQQAG